MLGSIRADKIPVIRRRLARGLAEFGGAFGDLGSFLPYVLGALTVGGLAPQGVLLGFGIFLLGAGWFYGVPMAVQPMKAVGAVLLTVGLSAGELAATGMMLGLLLLGLAATGALGRVVKWLPRSVSAGLQLGLGLAMALLGAEWMAQTPWLGALTLVSLVIFLRLPYCPAAPAALGLAVLAGWLAGDIVMPVPLTVDFALPALALPSWDEAGRAFGLAVLPQLPLTLTNAVIITAALAHDLFPATGARVRERNLAWSTGLANLVLTPFGALPMCHGAGGLQAQYRFGARTGAAPMILGGILIILGLACAESAALLLAAIPMAAGGALLFLAGADLALSRRLFDARPECWPAIIVTALLTLLMNPAYGLVAGWAVELLRRPFLQAVRGVWVWLHS